MVDMVIVTQYGEPVAAFESKGVAERFAKAIGGKATEVPLFVQPASAAYLVNARQRRGENDGR